MQLVLVIGLARDIGGLVGRNRFKVTGRHVHALGAVHIGTPVDAIEQIERGIAGDFFDGACGAQVDAAGSQCIDLVDPNAPSPREEIHAVRCQIGGELGLANGQGVTRADQHLTAAQRGVEQQVVGIGQADGVLPCRGRARVVGVHRGLLDIGEQVDGGGPVDHQGVCDQTRVLVHDLAGTARIDQQVGPTDHRRGRWRDRRHAHIDQACDVGLVARQIGGTDRDRSIVANAQVVEIVTCEGVAPAVAGNRGIEDRTGQLDPHGGVGTLDPAAQGHPSALLGGIDHVVARDHAKGDARARRVDPQHPLRAVGTDVAGGIHHARRHTVVAIGERLARRQTPGAGTGLHRGTQQAVDLAAAGTRDGENLDAVALFCRAAQHRLLLVHGHWRRTAGHTAGDDG